MSRTILVLGFVALLILPAPSFAAQPAAVPCKKIRAAVRAGRTPQQIMDEFGTDAAHIAKCMQSRGGRRTQKKKPTPAKSKTRSPVPSQPAPPASSSHRPAPPHSGFGHPLP